MSNMAYCRFRNTLPDLQDCFDHIDEYPDLSTEEREACKRLVKLCQQIADNYDEEYFADFDQAEEKQT